MKKLCSLLFVVLMISALVACTNDTVDKTTESAESTELKRVSDVIKDKEQEKTKGITNETKPTFDTTLVGLTFVSGDYEYTVQENGTVHISGYIGADSEITVPIELDGYSVTGIQENAFKGNKTIEVLVVPGQIKSIGDEAFVGCKSLHYVTIEDGVESIGYRAFQNDVNNGCSIVELKIADSVYKMGDHPFGLTNQISQERNGLSYVGNVVVDFADNFDGHIAFDENTKGVADGALDKDWGSNNQKSRLILDETLTFPEGVLYIGRGTFANQLNVKYFKIPSSVVEIGSYAMQFEFVNNCYGLYNSNATRKIYGTADSVAEKYAKSNGLNFVIISN